MDEVDKNKAIKKINEEFDQQISQVREELNEIVTREKNISMKLNLYFFQN